MELAGLEPATSRLLRVRLRNGGYYGQLFVKPAMFVV